VILIVLFLFVLLTLASRATLRRRMAVGKERMSARRAEPADAVVGVGTPLDPFAISGSLLEHLGPRSAVGNRA
jgi:hypothetical protein